MGLCLGGCATAQVNSVLSNLDRDCTRHYAGAIGGVVQATITFQIDCTPAKPVVVPVTPLSLADPVK